MAPSANCPACSASLELTNHESFDSWVCPAGHGLAATLSELYERAQEDEIHRLWDLAKAAPASDAGRPCPMCAQAMVSVTVPFDGDEVAEGEPGDTADTGEVPVDVCVADQVVWFDATELDQLPADLPDAQPTAEQDAALADIRRTFGEGVDSALESRGGLADHIAARMGQSARAFGLLSGSNAFGR